MRGVGKTTFLTDISHRLAKKKYWIVADLAVGNNLMRMLIDQLYENSSSQVKKSLIIYRDYLFLLTF